jgi:hypothetical protein
MTRSGSLATFPAIPRNQSCRRSTRRQRHVYVYPSRIRDAERRRLHHAGPPRPSKIRDVNFFRVLSFFRRMVLNLESTKCPAGSEAENQECNGRPKQKDGNHKKITSRESAFKSAHEQKNNPAHDPSSGYQKPNSKHAPPPIYRCGLARFRPERAAWNAV